MESADKLPATEETLTKEELLSLAEIDSTMFGFTKLDAPENAKTKTLVSRCVKYLEKALVAFHERRNVSESSRNADTEMSASHDDLYVKIFCKLGHLNLLLEDYPKALSAYQRYFALMDEHWKNSAFMYGLGLVYMHYNAFKWAIKTFQRVLYLDPGFVRSNEIHLRLAIMYKVLKEYDLSYKHFQLLLVDTSPCSMTKAEVSFHLAHLYEVQGKNRLAKEAYEKLLEQKDLPSKLKAEAYKQLGWMYFRIESLGDKPHRPLLSVNLIHKAVDNEAAGNENVENDS